MNTGFRWHSPAAAQEEQLSSSSVHPSPPPPPPAAVTVAALFTWILFAANHFSPSSTMQPPRKLPLSGAPSGRRLKKRRAFPLMGFTACPANAQVDRSPPSFTRASSICRGDPDIFQIAEASLGVACRGGGGEGLAHLRRGEDGLPAMSDSGQIHQDGGRTVPAECPVGGIDRGVRVWLIGLVDSVLQYLHILSVFYSTRRGVSKGVSDGQRWNSMSSWENLLEEKSRSRSFLQSFWQSRPSGKRKEEGERERERDSSYQYGSVFFFLLMME